jgi:quinol monooxygenase YgiN
LVNVLTVVATIRAAAAKGDALAALLTEQAAVVRQAEPGCLVYRVHRSTEDAALFLFYETYVDEAAFEAHRTSPHMAAFRARRDGQRLTDAPASVQTFRSLTV